MCVFMCALCFHSATLGWGVRCGCVCLGSGLSCSPPLLALLLGWVCRCVCPLLVPRHSWLGCAVWVRVFGLGFRLRPATPGRAVWVCVCVCVRSLPVLGYSWLGCAVWLCVLGLEWRLRPASCGLGAVVCVCVCVRSLPVLGYSWLGCAVWVCVLGLEWRLHPASCGWSAVVCVLLCARTACTPPLLAVVCGVCVCVFGLGFSCVCQSWLGCWALCVFFVCALGLCPATGGCSPRCVGWVLPGTCSCAVVRGGLCALPVFAATVAGVALVGPTSPLWMEQGNKLQYPLLTFEV